MSNLTITHKKTKVYTLPKLDKKAIKAFLQANPSIYLEKFKFLKKENLETLNWAGQDLSTLLPQLKALQRLMRLTHDLATAEALYEHGLHAAVQIAAIPEHKFVVQYASLFTPNGLSSKAQAQQVHQRALARKSKAVLTYTAIVQHRSAHYRATRFDNLSALTDSNYNDLPSYQDLFGDLDFCTCEECRSIFSPAAYFVDLMRLQDNYISKDTKANPPAQLLQDRRPDLWNLLLDCDHTNTLVPKLQIVNEVLLQTLGQGNSYEPLATTTYPFNLPFHLPLTQIQLYLGQNQQTLSSIWQALLPTGELNTTTLARQSLGLSPAQWALYSTPQTDPKQLAPLYGLPANQDLVSTLASVDTFLAQTGLSYVQLQELLYEDLSDWELKEGLERHFFINLDTTGKVSGFLYIDTDKTDKKEGKEKLFNLTIERLDYIHRFIRLAQALGWTLADLDWALRTIDAIVNTTNSNPPTIDDATLPYLAWMQKLRQQYKLSINQIGALIGTVKDVGKKNGPAFFDQVFNNPAVPNPPKWQDGQGNYNLTWNVPQPNSAVLSLVSDLQIQNALAAALQISQDDLLQIANQILQVLGVQDNKLPLPLANLSILYRLSQLPTLTGLSIQECLIALQLPGQPADALPNLAGPAGDQAQASLVLLQQFAQWLKTTPFSVEQLQFILTGDSLDPTIQNQMLGADKIANFLNELHTAIQPTLLTQDPFVTMLSPTLQSIFGSQTGDLGTQIYRRLQDQQVNYINGQGIITAIGANAMHDNVKEALKAIALPIIPRKSSIPLIPLIPPHSPIPLNEVENSWDQVITSIVNTLQNSYQLQQTTLTQKLASLYNVGPDLVHALEVWGGLRLGDLMASQLIPLLKPNPYAAVPLLQRLLSKPAKRWSKKMVLQPESQGVVKHLQVLQQYAVLLTSLGLSPAEAEALIDHPQYFGISYKQGNKTNASPQFTVANIQTLYQFKQVVQALQDTQNHLLDYFLVASTSGEHVQVIAQKLAQFTQWNVGQIQFLLEKLHLLSPAPGRIPLCATVAGVSQLQTYFNLAQQLNINIGTLWQMTQAIDPTTDFAAYQSLANALGAGLQKQYQDQPNVLSVLEGKLHEVKRGALLGLVIYQLRTQKNLPITTARDLYEYLLIDVEVSGILQTSYVKEAISAVQLYVYRCLNSLEAGIVVHPELHRWWPWVEHYRVWQANREVFLYPENYIQPELRKDKTPQFSQLENDLQQSNLTNEVIEKAVRSYIDGFAEVATLQIVGSYLYANDEGNPPNQQTLYLVGRTTTKAYTYYYRSATFEVTSDTNTYADPQWTPWIEINLQIKSSLASPVYAFNRLFLFWAEAKPGPSDQDAAGKPTKKRFETTLYYAFYDFNQQWSAPQQLVEPILLPDKINTQADAEALVWQQVKAFFAPPAQLICWSWGDKKIIGENCFRLGTLNKKLGIQIFEDLPVIEAQPLKDVIASECPNAALYQNKLYCFYRDYNDKTALWYSILEKDTWQGPTRIVGVEKLAGNPSSVVYQDILCCFYYSSEDYMSLHYAGFLDGLWQNYNVSIGMYNPFVGYNAVVFHNRLYYFYYGTGYINNTDYTGQVWYSMLEKDTWQGPVQVPNVKNSANPKAIAYQDKLYCFYQDYNSNGQLSYSILEKDTWQDPTQILNVNVSGDISPIVYRGKLYCFYQAKDAGHTAASGKICYVVLEEDGWKDNQLIGLTIPTQSSIVVYVYQNMLCCFYRSNDGQVWYVPGILDNRIQCFLGLNVEDTQEKIPPYVVAGTDLTWSIQTGPDGSQFLCIPSQDNANPNQYIRLDSMVVHDLSQVLLSQGLDGFLSLDTQQTTEIKMDGSKTLLLDFAGANGLYYWELFFHMPFLVAHSLSTQQQFELAKKWYAYIFNPTVSKNDWDLFDYEDPNDKYWRFWGLRSSYNGILQDELRETWAQEVKADVQDVSQLATYHEDPFDPHAIARLRPIAYQKTLVMHYIDNLLAWGDNLFRQYTAETIVEATMLYVMAYDLLGKQPVSLGPCPLPDPESLKDIASHYNNSVGNIPEFLIDVEQSQASILVANLQDNPNNYIPGDYFGLPENDQFIAYWDTIQQRLYNIRHSLNINGIYQQLALFEPPINPMQLVAAIAAGEGVGQALAGNQVDIPYYRFSVMVAKAQSMTQTVIQLGQSLLGVLEKQDAEQLSLLYSSNQKNLLALTRTSKQDQLAAASQTLQSLQASLQNAQDRMSHYSQLLNTGFSGGEIAQIALESAAIYLQTAAQPIKAVAVGGYLLPNVYGLADGGMEFGNAIIQGANIAEGAANALSMAAGLASSVAGYQRRAEDWQLQQTLAQDDINQTQYQIVAAQYQEHMASEEIRLLEKQIDQEQAVEAFLKNKFTRVQLYQWMVGKLAALYFQAYQLAYNLALQAEQAWQFERGKDHTFVQPVYWNDLYHGLIAGEALQLDLQRMEKSYMDQDVRSFEIEKIISLAQLDPQALQNLKATGSCSFDLIEKEFDYDFPGHYCRQIKSINVSFPALLGPYQNIHATLTQTGNKTLIKADENGVKYLLGKDAKQPDSSVLRVDMRANQQVALSQGNDDDGLFVLNFDDPRYLPFEGTGAVSSWRLDMPRDCNPINFDSLTDVIIRLKYTALAGGKDFQAIVRQNIGSFNGYQPLFMAQAYASAWYSFIQQGNPLNPLIFTVSPALFRPNLKNYMVTDITMVVIPTAAGGTVTNMPKLTLTAPDLPSGQSVALQKGATPGMVTGTISGLSLPVTNAANWQLAVTNDPGKLMTAANVSNMIISLGYTASFS